MIREVNIDLFQLICIILVLNIKSLVLTLHNRMVVLKGKTTMLLKWVSHSLFIVMLLCLFGFLPSKLVLFLSTGFPLMFYLTTHHMNYSIKKPLKYDFLKTFGCVCYPLLCPYNKHKLEYRSAECIFIGYSSDHKGFLCLHKLTSWVYVTRHAVFNESHFLFCDFLTSSSFTPNSLSSSKVCSTFSSTIFLYFPSPSLPSTSTSSPSSSSPFSSFQSQFSPPSASYSLSLSPRAFTLSTSLRLLSTLHKIFLMF